MRVVVAPDSFGGTLSAGEAVAAIAAGWSRVAPGDELVALPMSDGGPGFVDVLASQLAGGELRAATVTGPLGRPTAANVLIYSATGTAYVETAQAAGLHLLTARERDPLRATTAGVGELICHALDAGARTVVVGLGGSATTDGGAGALSALGLRMLGTWPAPAGVDRGRLDPRLDSARLVAATDVDNPLCGPTGAAAVFGPQKGATPAQVRVLDAALARWAAVLARDLGMPVAGQPGAGAAGGLGAGLLALGAQRVSGVQLVAERVGLAAAVAAADLVLTGEGSFDAQSLRGKVVAGVAAAAARAGKPCLVLAGRVSLPAWALAAAAACGVTRSYALVSVAGSVAAARAHPARWLAETAAQAAGEWAQRA
ncbi:MAG: glycerate kinase family protein [Frankiaceae bacterium]